MENDLLNQTAQWATIGQFFLALIFGVFTVVTTLNWKPKVPITLRKQFAIIFLTSVMLISAIYVISWLSIFVANFLSATTADIATVAVRAVWCATMLATGWGIAWIRYIWPAITKMSTQTTKKENTND